MIKLLLSIVAGLYAISPFDILPEFVLGWLGWLDDLLVVYLMWRYFYAPGRQPYRGRDASGAGQGSARSQTTGADRSAGDRDRDPYAVLGVSCNASPEEIKKAYKRLAAQYHPDKVHHLAEDFRELAEKRFKEIQAAYDAIGRR